MSALAPRAPRPPLRARQGPAWLSAWQWGTAVTRSSKSPCHATRCGGWSQPSSTRPIPSREFPQRAGQAALVAVGERMSTDRACRRCTKLPALCHFARACCARRQPRCGERGGDRSPRARCRITQLVRLRLHPPLLFGRRSRPVVIGSLRPPAVAYGRGYCGALGTGALNDAHVPERMRVAPGFRVRRVHAGWCVSLIAPARRVPCLGQHPPPAPAPRSGATRSS